MKITLTELRNTHPLTISVLVEALEQFIDDVEFDEPESDERETK